LQKSTGSQIQTESKEHMKGFYVIFWWMWMHYEKELMGQGKDDTVMDVSTTSKLEC